MTRYQKQLEFLNWEFGVFFHFGIRSFCPGRKDWDGIEMPAEGFAPTQLDCEQWVTTAKAAGATYAILTAKYHDGFALWPSVYSKYGVAQSPWREGKSDYLWFDDCGSEGHEFDRARIVSVIYRMQPDILIFFDPEWISGVIWVGNKSGYALLNNPLVVNKTDFSELTTEEHKLADSMFLPAECDCKIRNTWFYDLKEETLKSTDKLFGMCEMSVGHGSNFLLNIGPDDRGLLPEADTKRLPELGERIKAAFGTPLPYNAHVREGNIYTMVHSDLGASDWRMPREARSVAPNMRWRSPRAAAISL